jgi:hypothetical protein
LLIYKYKYKYISIYIFPHIYNIYTFRMISGRHGAGGLITYHIVNHDFPSWMMTDIKHRQGLHHVKVCLCCLLSCLSLPLLSLTVAPFKIFKCLNKKGGVWRALCTGMLYNIIT